MTCYYFKTERICNKRRRNYGFGFEFGTDSPDKMVVEYTVNKALLARSERTLARYAYHNLLQDFVCSLSICVARDIVRASARAPHDRKHQMTAFNI